MQMTVQEQVYAYKNALNFLENLEMRPVILMYVLMYALLHFLETKKEIDNVNLHVQLF